MNETTAAPVAPDAPVNPQLMDAETLIRAVGNFGRWRILHVLSDGEAYGPKDISDILGMPPTTITQNLAILRRAGLVVQGRGRLYKIPPHHFAVPGQRHLELGHFLLRFGLQTKT